MSGGNKFLTTNALAWLLYRNRELFRELVSGWGHRARKLIVSENAQKDATCGLGLEQ